VCIYIYIFFRSRKTHPGAVVHLSDNPLDLSKVRAFFEYVFFALLFHPYHNFIIDIIQFYRDAIKKKEGTLTRVIGVYSIHFFYKLGLFI